MSEEKKEFIPCPAPVDQEGYVSAFTVDQKQDISHFFTKYGFVVIKDVLNAGEVEASVSEIWTELEEADERLDRTDPATWGNLSSRHIMKNGILTAGISQGVQAWRNRQNEDVYKAFAIVLKDDNILCSLDRQNVMRPTKKVHHPDNPDNPNNLDNPYP